MIDIRKSDVAETGLTRRLVDIMDVHANEAGHPYQEGTLGLTAWDGETFAGGAEYQMNYGWCFLKLLAVEPAFRGRNVGSRLMDELERLMQAEGAIGIWLDTYGYQAAPFYTRHGFEEFGRLAGATPNEDRIFMRKLLGANA